MSLSKGNATSTRWTEQLLCTYNNSQQLWTLGSLLLKRQMFPRTLRLSTWVATREKLDNLMSHAPPAVKYHSTLFMAKEGLYWFLGGFLFTEDRERSLNLHCNISFVFPDVIWTKSHIFPFKIKKKLHRLMCQIILKNCPIFKNPPVTLNLQDSLNQNLLLFL